MLVIPPSADARVRLSRSTLSAQGGVVEPASALLTQARVYLPAITLEAYALARIIASEFGNGTPEEQLAVAVADARRARGGIYIHAIGSAGTFGRQGASRKVATSQDPTLYNAKIAQQAIAGVGVQDFGSAIQYFDAISQLALWQRGDALHPATVLEMWHFNKRPISRTKDASGRQVATLGAAAGGGVQWIGPRKGVRTNRLMLFEGKASDAVRDARYQSAVAALGLTATDGLPIALGALGAALLLLGSHL